MNDTMRTCLEQLGFGKIATAEDGQAAFETFRFMLPDIVLTDWDLGSVSGVELINTIRRHPLSPNRLVPIIMVTGYGSLHRVKMAADSGVNSYIVQPFDIEKLVESLERIINFPTDFIESDEYCGPVRRGMSEFREEPENQDPPQEAV